MPSFCFLSKGYQDNPFRKPRLGQGRVWDYAQFLRVYLICISCVFLKRLHQIRVARCIAYLKVYAMHATLNRVANRQFATLFATQPSFIRISCVYEKNPVFLEKRSFFQKRVFCAVKSLVFIALTLSRIELRTELFVHLDRLYTGFFVR